MHQLTAPTAKPIVSAAPTSEPVTLAQAKKQLELPTAQTDHDDHLNRLIQLAREQVESDSGVVGFATTFSANLDTWPARYIELYGRPLISVTSITYTDTAGSGQTLAGADYDVDLGRVAPVIWPAYGVTWPALRDTRNAITVTYVAGHATVGAIPEIFKQAVLAMLSREFLDREGRAGRFDDAYESLVARMRRSSYP